MKILLIDNYDSFTYNLFHYISNFKKNVEVFRNDKIDGKTILKKNPELENEDIIWYKKYEEVHEECMSIWDKLTKQYTVYIRDVLFECASGYNKFGVNIGRADWLIETENSTSTRIKEIFKLDNNNSEHLSKLLKTFIGISKKSKVNFIASSILFF